MLTILSAFAQAESEGASENAKLTNLRKFKQGIPAVRGNATDFQRMQTVRSYWMRSRLSW